MPILSWFQLQKFYILNEQNQSVHQWNHLEQIFRILEFILGLNDIHSTDEYDVIIWSKNKVKLLSYRNQTFEVKVLTKENFFLSNGLPWIRLWTLFLTFGGSKTANANPIRDQNHIAIFCPTLHCSRQALDTNSNRFQHALSQNLMHFKNSWRFYSSLRHFITNFNLRL